LICIPLEPPTIRVRSNPGTQALPITSAFDCCLDGYIVRHMAYGFGEEGIPVHFFEGQGHGSGGYERDFVLGEGIGVEPC
jgi:hypothetical protein